MIQHNLFALQQTALAQGLSQSQTLQGMANMQQLAVAQGRLTGLGRSTRAELSQQSALRDPRIIYGCSQANVLGAFQRGTETTRDLKPKSKFKPIKIRFDSPYKRALKNKPIDIAT